MESHTSRRRYEHACELGLVEAGIWIVLDNGDYGSRVVHRMCRQRRGHLLLVPASPWRSKLDVDLCLVAPG